MKSFFRSVFLLVTIFFGLQVFGGTPPSDAEINAALKKQLILGKTTLRECEALFGKPISVVENRQATVYAFKSSQIVKGLKLNAASNASQSSASSLSNSSAAKVVKGAMSSGEKFAQSQKVNEDDKNKVQRNLKSDKESVDKIINFVFKENKLLSYKISLSH